MRQRLVFVLTSGIFIFIALVGSWFIVQQAFAAPTDVKLPKPQNQAVAAVESYVSIPAIAFIPTNKDTQENYSILASNEGYVLNNTGNYNTFVAPLNLPHLSVMKRISAFGRVDYGVGIGVALIRCRHDNANCEYVASVEADKSSLIQHKVLVDNQNYYYLLEATTTGLNRVLESVRLDLAERVDVYLLDGPARGAYVMAIRALSFEVREQVNSLYGPSTTVLTVEPVGWSGLPVDCSQQVISEARSNGYLVILEWQGKVYKFYIGEDGSSVLCPN